VEALPPDGVTGLMCHPGLAPTHVGARVSSSAMVELPDVLQPGARAIVERLAFSSPTSARL